MRKRNIFIIVLLLIAPCAFGANNFIPKKFNTVTSHNDVYPYRLNNAKINSNKNTTSTNTINSNSAAPIGKRGVVKRTTNARAATGTINNSAARRVVPRNNTFGTVRAAQPAPAVRNVGGRGSSNMVIRSVAPIRTRAANVRSGSNSSANTKVSSQRCFSDYKECMEMYCLREDAAYNRCYCSAKLAQIDSKYLNKIDFLIQEIIRLKYNTDVTSAEIKEYWDKTVGTYTQTNPWVNIENALNIDWADTQSRVRGQQAFNTGHEYCVNNLRACSYMATNLRDAYKSEISRDCATYEKGLQKIQDAAESVIEIYNH